MNLIADRSRISSIGPKLESSRRLKPMRDARKNTEARKLLKSMPDFLITYPIRRSYRILKTSRKLIGAIRKLLDRKLAL